METRHEFVEMATQDGSNISLLCKRYGISRNVGYRWIKRYSEGGYEALADRSRKPLTNPNQTSRKLEVLIVNARKKHPAWGARKLKRYLENQNHKGLPSCSTITEVLRRKDMLNYNPAKGPIKPYERFERSAPNELWQMDFKGHFPVGQDIHRCHPLTILDDHSRYSLCIKACYNERLDTVKTEVTKIFERYGLPKMILTDNGAPWGNNSPTNLEGYSQFALWLIRLGVNLIHGRPGHPQTQGKEERFHRSFKMEALNKPYWKDMQECDRYFKKWRHIYNHQRPHEAINLQVPASRYKSSERSMPKQLPKIEYDQFQIVRKVDKDGKFTYKGHSYYLGRSFTNELIALQPTNKDNVIELYFSWKRIGMIELNQKPKTPAGFIQVKKYKFYD